MAYTQGGAARLAQFFANDPHFKVLMSGLMCWDAVLYMINVASGHTNPKFKDRRSLPGDVEPMQVLCSNPKIATRATDIPADSVVMILRKKFPTTPFVGSHAMLSIDAMGNCIGNNNQCIGGPNDFGLTSLGQRLTWNHPKNPTYRNLAEPNQPVALQERIVIYKRVSELLG